MMRRAIFVGSATSRAHRRAAAAGSEQLCSRLGFSSMATTAIKMESRPIVELREYALYPEHAAAYLQATNGSAELRRSLSPLRLFSLPETGGPLHTATHLYHYAGGHVERDETRRRMADNADWKTYVASIRPYAQTQSSTIWVEAPLVKEQQQHGLSEIPSNLPGDANNCILEFRRYGAGLPSKLNAPGTDPTTSLVTVLSTEVGRLNEVMEIWRHGNGSTAMETSRHAARGAQEWRSAIASIADLAIEFTSTIHKPTKFSPIR